MLVLSKSILFIHKMDWKGIFLYVEYLLTCVLH